MLLTRPLAIPVPGPAPRLVESHGFCRDQRHGPRGKGRLHHGGDEAAMNGDCHEVMVEGGIKNPIHDGLYIMVDDGQYWLIMVDNKPSIMFSNSYQSWSMVQSCHEWLRICLVYITIISTG